MTSGVGVYQGEVTGAGGGVRRPGHCGDGPAGGARGLEHRHLQTDRHIITDDDEEILHHTPLR